MATESMREQLQQPKISIFDKFKNNLSKIDKNLKSQKEELKLDDALLGDNTFFKFLNDLLNSIKKKSDKNEELLKELKINEALSKEKFFTLMTNELEQNKHLAKRQKSRLAKICKTNMCKI